MKTFMYLLLVSTVMSAAVTALSVLDAADFSTAPAEAAQPRAETPMAARRAPITGDKAIDAYMAFFYNEAPAGGSYIERWNMYERAYGKGSYGLLDVEGLAHPRCIAYTVATCFVLDYIDDQLVLLWSDNTAFWPDNRLLNDGSLLYVCSWYSHATYEHYVLNSDGQYEETEWFAGHPIEWPEGWQRPECPEYLINGKDVTPAEYEAFAARVFAIGQDKITWHTIPPPMSHNYRSRQSYAQ